MDKFGIISVFMSASPAVGGIAGADYLCEKYIPKLYEKSPSYSEDEIKEINLFLKSDDYQEFKKQMTIINEINEHDFDELRETKPFILFDELDPSAVGELLNEFSESISLQDMEDMRFGDPKDLYDCHITPENHQVNSNIENTKIMEFMTFMLGFSLNADATRPFNKDKLLQRLFRT